MLNLLVKNWKLRVLRKLLVLSWLYLYLWFYVWPSQQAVTSILWLEFAIVIYMTTDAQKARKLVDRGIHVCNYIMI